MRIAPSARSNPRRGALDMASKILFSAGTSNNLEKEFRERAKYKNLVNFESMLDTWYENAFFGRVNSKFEPVIIVPGVDDSILKTFPSVADDVSALGFVAEAFRNFRRDYLQRVQETNISFPIFLEGLVPTAGYLNFETYYSEYTTFLTTSYLENLSSNASIVDFESFVKEFMSIAESDLKNYPITKTGFLLSKHNDIKTTGLVLELANLNPQIDLSKGEILQDPNFSCYLDYASASGFYVDKNSPWRLMVNLDKEIVRLLMRAEKPETIETPDGPIDRPPPGVHATRSASEIMDSIYRIKTHPEDLFMLQSFLENLYIQVKNKVAFVPRLGYNGNESIMRRSQVSALSEETWLALLLRTRLYELDSYDQRFYEVEAHQAIQTYSIYGLSHATAKIGSTCSKVIEQVVLDHDQFRRRTENERRENVESNTDT